MDGDAERIEYIQQIMGGALMGRPQTRRFFFAYGPAGTGKSTIVNVMKALLGEYHFGSDWDVITNNGKRNASAAQPEMMKLRGMRLITMPESRNGARIDGARVKQFIGGDTISAWLYTRHRSNLLSKARSFSTGTCSHPLTKMTAWLEKLS